MAVAHALEKVVDRAAGVVKIGGAGRASRMQQPPETWKIDRPRIGQSCSRSPRFRPCVQDRVVVVAQQWAQVIEVVVQFSKESASRLRLVRVSLNKHAG